MNSDDPPLNWDAPSAPWEGGIEWTKFLPSRGQPGGVELVAAGADPETRLFELLASWTLLRRRDGELAYPHLRIITADSSKDTTLMIAGAAQAFERLFDHALPDTHREALGNGLGIVPLRGDYGNTLSTQIASAAENALVYVPRATARLAFGASPSTPDTMSPWARQLTALSAAVCDSTGVVVVDVGGDAPLTVADTLQLSALANLGYSMSSAVSIGTATQDTLEELWMSAWINDNTEIALELSQNLRERFGWPTPDRTTVFHALREYCRSNASADASRQAAFPVPIPALADSLHRVFNGPSVDFDALAIAIDDTPPEWAALILLCVADEAFHRSWRLDVLSIASPSGLSPALAAIAANLLMTSVEGVLLSQAEDQALEELGTAVGEVIGYIAANPTAAQIRLRLADALAPERSDMVGISVLAFLLQGAAQADVEIKDRSDLVSAPATDDELMTFVRRALAPYPKGSIVMGQLAIAESIIVPSADALMERLLHLISHSQLHGVDDLDARTHEMLSLVGVELAKHSSKPNQDLDILRFWGSHLSLSGKPQRSRDVAESMLMASDGDPERTRLAWLGYADIYNRGQNQIQAAIGMCCALAVDVPRTADELIRELSTTARILRDARLHPLAERVCAILTSRVSASSSSPIEANRAEFLHLSIRMQRVVGDSNAAPDEVIVLIDDLTRHLDRARTLADAALPAAMLLGQLVNFASAKKVTLNEHTHDALRSARSLLDGRQALLFDIACGRADSANSLLAYVQQLERARHTSDVGYDLQTAALAARRILASPLARADKSLVVFASELLNDLGIPAPRSAPSNATELPSALDDPASHARTLSTLGVDIVTLASNTAGHVVVTLSRQGKIEAAHELAGDVFSLDYLVRWSTKFPFGFADISSADAPSDDAPTSGRSQPAIPVDEDARFVASMQPMRLELDLNRPTIFVTDPLLQSIPPNLFLIDGEFVGRRVAVGSSPSLTWLHRAVTTDPARFGPPAAWISDSGGAAHWTAPLNVLAGRVADTLAAHAIPLNRSTEPAASLRGAEIAIIGAHGGLGGADRYFRVVADDARKQIAPDELTTALVGARVIVLFVCSGGRVDQHPFAQSTVGLPKQLVSAGAEAVIASPWPLDVRVPDYWLPVFLRAWEAGETLMEANFRANAKVAASTGSPEFGLAMTVYGNGLARRQASGGNGS